MSTSLFIDYALILASTVLLVLNEDVELDKSLYFVLLISALLAIYDYH